MSTIKTREARYLEAPYGELTINQAKNSELAELREALKVAQEEVKRLEQWHAEMADDRNALQAQFDSAVVSWKTNEALQEEIIAGLQAKLSAIEAQGDDLTIAYFSGYHAGKKASATVAPAQSVNELVEFPPRIMSMLNDVADRKGTEFHGPWEDGNGEPLQDDADAAIAWINAKAATPEEKQ